MRLKKEKAPLLAALCVLLVGILLRGLCGLWGTENPYNSYSLQAARWLAGHLDLGKNYAHLEIASFGGKFFVSFPPFPSVVLLPFVLLFGTATPDGLISIVFAAIGAYFAAKLALSYGADSDAALFWALFVTLGGNLLSIFCTGWVWFLAQTMAFSLLLCAFYAARSRKSTLALFLWAAAIGCRPFSALCLPILLYLLHEGGLRASRKTILHLLPALLLGLSYALLNALRFGNPLEFGHSYLPEFLAEPQFSLSYLGQNFKTLFRLPRLVGGQLEFPLFNGFAFFLASPIFLAYSFLFLKRKKEKIDLCIFAVLLSYLFLFCLHRTMGGWHFGHRYTVDMLPLCLLGCLRLLPSRFLPLLPAFLLGFLLHSYGILLLLGRI